MTTKRRIGWLAAAFIAVGAPALAQDGEPFDRDCMDEYGRNLCQPEKWSEIVASFELKPAEVVQAAGWRGVRVFTIAGYSRDLPMVSVLHTERSEYGLALNPRLEVRGAREGAAAAPALTREAWSRLAVDADVIGELATAAPVRQSEEGGVSSSMTEAEDEIVICLHAWVTVTEVLGDGGVVRRVRNACGEDPLFDAGYELSARALRGFPHCNHLNPGNYRNESQQLNRCLALLGEDRLAAAAVLNRLDGEVFEEASAITQFATPETQVGGAAPGDSLATALGLDGARLVRLYTTSVTFDRAGVVAEGQVHRYAQDEDDDRAADVRHVWRSDGGDWRIVEFTVGPWRPL